MTLAHSLREYIEAAFSGLWIESHEHDDALAEIAELCHGENWRLAAWDLEQGLRLADQESDQSKESTADPLAAIRAAPSLAVAEGTTLLVLVNFHRFLQSAEIVQALARQLAAGKQTRVFVLILSPVVQIPVELEKLFVVVEHPLPGRDQLEVISRGVATGDDELPCGSALARRHKSAPAHGYAAVERAVRAGWSARRSAEAQHPSPPEVKTCNWSFIRTVRLAVFTAKRSTLLNSAT